MFGSQVLLGLALTVMLMLVNAGDISRVDPNELIDSFLEKHGNCTIDVLKYDGTEASREQINEIFFKSYYKKRPVKIEGDFAGNGAIRDLTTKR